jgi:hypothetical protein
MGSGVPVLIISGSMGSGKTTVLGEASDLLAAADVCHAAVDLDALGIVHAPSGGSGDIEFCNLATVWRNFAAAGVDRLIVACALESAATLDGIRGAVPGAEVVICRLRAAVTTMEERVARRDPGILRDMYVARVAELEAALDRVRLEDFTLANDEVSITTVAQEMLSRAGWLRPGSDRRRDGAVSSGHSRER